MSALGQDGRLVDFVIGGAQKGGTTALCAYLREHPELLMARRKQVHFFDEDSHFANGSPDYSIYHAAFDAGVGRRLTGEATPIYMYWEPAPRRMWQYNPHMKLILLLRNPIERAYSHWTMEHSKGRDSASLWDALSDETERCREALPDQHRVYSYIDRGVYSEQLRRIWRYFPPPQVLVMKSEHLRDEADAALAEVCDFLGVAHLRQVNARILNSSTYTRPMAQRERDFLCSMFRSEIAQLENMLGWDCADWLNEA